MDDIQDVSTLQSAENWPFSAGGGGGGGPIAPAPLGYGPVVHQEGHQACKKSPLYVH